MPQLSNLLRISSIHFWMYTYLVACFLRVTVSLLCRSQGRTISFPFTDNIGINWNMYLWYRSLSVLFLVHRRKEWYRAWGAPKSVLNNRGYIGKKAKKCLYERVIVPTALHGAEAWERKKVNVLEMKCRSLVGVSRMDRVRNEDLRSRAGIERELAGRTDQTVSRWFGHVERMDEYCMARRVLMAEVSGGRYEVDWSYDGWIVWRWPYRQQRNDGGGCATMRER